MNKDFCLTCYNSEYKHNLKGIDPNRLFCAYKGGYCNPKPCEGCPKLRSETIARQQDTINKWLDECEKCPKYFSCNKVAELNDKLKKIEERLGE